MTLHHHWKESIKSSSMVIGLEYAKILLSWLRSSKGNDAGKSCDLRFALPCY